MGEDDRVDDEDRDEATADEEEPDRWARLYAASTEGFVTLRGAAAVDIPADTLRGKAAREAWPKLQLGQWALPGATVTHRMRCLAALEAIGGRSLVARRSAAYEQGLLRDEPETVEIVVPADRRTPARPGVTAFQSSTLRQCDATETDGMRMTVHARTVRDLAAVLPRMELMYTAITARQRRHCAEEDLREQYARMGTAAGRADFGWVLDEMRALDSGFEWTVRDGLRDTGLPAPHPKPYRLVCPDGRGVHIDVAWPEWRVGVEVWSLSHDLGKQTTDHTRHNQATIADWRILYIGWHRWLHHRERFVDEVRGALRLAGAPV